MRLIRSLDELTPDERGAALSIGNFDGVHRGHATLINRLVRRARERDRKSIVFTFDPHPAHLLRPLSAPMPLTWPERKAELLGELGVDVVIAYPTDREILQHTAEEFFQNVVLDRLSASLLVEGPDFCFGRHRSGNLERLAELCAQHGRELEVVLPVLEDHETISSSRVRTLIQAGEIRAANRLLTRPYRLQGQVITGVKRARQLGFPTANLAEIATLLPAPGVYACRAFPTCVPPHDDSKDDRAAGFPAALNLGPSPTFADPTQKVEVHLLNFAGELYGTNLAVDFLDRLRDIQTFENVDQLKTQLSADTVAALHVFYQTDAPR